MDNLQPLVDQLLDPGDHPLYKRIRIAVEIMRRWRQWMGANTAFKTPDTQTALCYTVTEAGEVLDAHLKATRSDLRNRPGSPIRGEYADTLAMAVTALIGVQIDNIANHQVDRSPTSQTIVNSCLNADDERSNAVLTCILAAHALHLHTMGHKAWIGFVSLLISHCVYMLGDEAWMAYMETLANWEERAKRKTLDETGPLM